jgi:hypothetical protein
MKKETTTMTTTTRRRRRIQKPKGVGSPRHHLLGRGSREGEKGAATGASGKGACVMWTDSTDQWRGANVNLVRKLQS